MTATVLIGRVPAAQVAQVLTAARLLITDRGWSRHLFTQPVPGRPWNAYPLSGDAAIGIATGHGPYPGCLRADCERCPRADAARAFLARRIYGGRLPAGDRYAPVAVIERWATNPATREREVLRELAAAAAAAREAGR